MQAGGGEGLQREMQARVQNLEIQGKSRFGGWMGFGLGVGVSVEEREEK